MSATIDDKSEHCVPFVVECLRRHRQAHSSAGASPPPFFVGLNGVQGAGKTTLVKTLLQTLSNAPHNLRTIEFSIDDLYLTRDEQLELAASYPDNPLIQHRGQPSTHSVDKGLELFAAISRDDRNVKIPSYDKSMFQGGGDRRPESEWQIVNREGEQPVEVIIFEGWCVGFRALSAEEVARKWVVAKEKYEVHGEAYNGRLGRVELGHVIFINERLREYEAMTNKLGAFIHIDAEETQYVYKWRHQQEAVLRAVSGTGMTEHQVEDFVNGYYPAYELYTEGLRQGICSGKGRNLRLVVGGDRTVKKIIEI